MSLDEWAVCVYTAVFCFATLKRHHFQWFWFAVVVWLVLGVFSARIMPNILGITTLNNLYLIHFYAFLGSIFFFINSISPLNDTKDNAYYHSPKAGSFLTLFAVSNVAMHMAFLYFLLFKWLLPTNDEIQKTLSMSFSLMFYTLNPFHLYTLQALAILISLLHRSLTKQKWHVFSFSQIQALAVFFLIMIFAYQIKWYLIFD